MMNFRHFKGTLVITDPSYFAKDSDWGNTFDYKNHIISKDLGFTDYIWLNTGYGDGSWGIYSLDKITGQLELEDHISRVLSAMNEVEKSSGAASRNKLQEILKKETPLGEFCVDSGTFGVFYLDDVLRYYPNFLADLGGWCYTIVPDFIGLVDIDQTISGSDEGDFKDFCIKGIGNKTFYSR